MPGTKDNIQPSQSPKPETGSNSKKKAVVVGLYGLPGSGKTFLLNQLKQDLGETDFVFYEGSQMIANVAPGGLNGFQNMGDQAKLLCRQRAIDAIGENCAKSGRAAVVAGHFMFWSESEGIRPEPVCTQNDLDTYTHILYLDVPAGVIAQRRLTDLDRSREPALQNHLWSWQQLEKSELRDRCRENGIQFFVVSESPTLLNRVSTLLKHFKYHNEEYNLSQAKGKLDEAVSASQGQLERVMVMDADRTLAAEDAGALFWAKIATLGPYKSDTLKSLFSSRLGYSYTAFRQAVLLYEESADDQKFEDLCNGVAAAVTMYPEFVCLLQMVAEQEHVGAVVFTSGLRLVWEKVLKREGLCKKVKVIGGGRIADGIVVSAAVKGALVAHLKDRHDINVWAFGDSPLDLDMLKEADRAIVVVGKEETRSKRMDSDLEAAINKEGLRTHQVLLPRTVSKRMTTKELPTITLTDPGFVIDLLCNRHTHSALPVLNADHRNGAKLLATPMRDATVAGPVLREAHRRVGWYLAIEFLPDVIGLEPSIIKHVQGHEIKASRLWHEQQTTIVALMRGGEPMAYGVNDAFPLAMFVHAKDADDIKHHHLEGRVTVILVDSVVNSGKTIVEFVEHVRKLHATIRIMVVAGVVQAGCVSGVGDGGLKQALAHHPKLHLVTLRLSDNKFTGKGTTDTGHRLFNTTHLG